MRDFLQGRINLVQALRESPFDVTYHDLCLILTAVMSACAAWRWPGEGFDQKRFVESLIQFSSPALNLTHISLGALLEKNQISESQTPWADQGQGDRIFTGADIDSSLAETASRFPGLSMRNLKNASYANLIYRWLRCGYSHTYWVAGNTTHVAPSRLPAQISYIGRHSDGRLIRIASFHLDYLVQVAQEQVSTLGETQLEKPDEWWIESSNV